jgi:prepilin-type N-terminal cleavage/methylation domain-containing protein
MNRNGFTLIELVMLLVLIGIIAAFVAPRLGNVTSTKAGAFRDKLRADIRYAQNLAMTESRRYRVYINTAPSPMPNGYAVVNDLNSDGWGATGGNEYAADPAGGGNLSVTLNVGQYADITVSMLPAVGFIEFNSLGAPTTAVTLMITPGSQTVTITAQTGAVN